MPETDRRWARGGWAVRWNRCYGAQGGMRSTPEQVGSSSLSMIPSARLSEIGAKDYFLTSLVASAVFPAASVTTTRTVSGDFAAASLLPFTVWSHRIDAGAARSAAAAR